MSGMDLDSYLPDDATLDRWANGVIDLTGEQARALVAEVRRLRALVPHPDPMELAWLNALVGGGCFVVDEDGNPLTEPFKRDGGGISAKVTAGGYPRQIVAANGTVLLDGGMAADALRPGDLWTYGP